MLAKLQPHRTMHLQGFDGYGCTASLHSASSDGFTITGQWGEQDDFVVLVLWDRDNQIEHPRLRYLPDSSFAGMSLAFDFTATNCVQIDSDLYPWIDWAFLNVTYTDGSTQQVRLSDHTTGASYTPATVTFTLLGIPTGLDYIELSWLDKHFNYRLTGGDSIASAVHAVANAINAASSTTGVSATWGGGDSITLTYDGLTGSVLGKGANAHRISVNGSVFGAGSELWSPEAAVFSGGVSPTTWHVSIDFDSLDHTDIQKAWLTFAPPIPYGETFTPGAFSVVASNWTVTGGSPLQVAGPGSVRIEENSPWAQRTGYWEAAPADGFAFWSSGRAIRSAWTMYEARYLTIETHCQGTHDIYLGTRLDTDCGKVTATLDGGSPVTVDLYGSPAQVRRLLFAGVAAGAHTVVIECADKRTESAGWYAYFDFLECAVRSEVTDAPEVRTDIGVATDFDTDATYKLSPQRLAWAIQALGLTGELDHYMGVFWWPVRKMRTLATTWSQESVVTFSGTPTFGRHTYLVLGGTTIDHLTLIGDTADTVVLALAQLVNQGSTVFWAEVSGTTLTLHGLAGSANYHIGVSVDTHGAGFSASVSTSHGSAVAVEWGVDETATDPINDPVAAWHSDFFSELQAAGIGVTASFSQELVNPPDNPGGGHVWIQRWWDNTPVSTATGFGSLTSSHCCLGGPVLDYMKRAYSQLAGLMGTAGLTPRLQFGEVLWWYQANASGMAFYDVDTKADYVAAHPGHTLAHFYTTNDSPSVNSYIDADFLRARLKAYIEAIRTYVLGFHSSTQFELLWPMDVNDPDTRQLNRYVNLPTEWETRAGSGFDTLTVEGFQYGGVDHNVDKARRCAGYPFAELSWPVAYCRYLMGLYYSGWPWQREYLAARRTGVPLLKIWAWDHLGLFGWPIPLPTEHASAAIS